MFEAIVIETNTKSLNMSPHAVWTEIFEYEEESLAYIEDVIHQNERFNSQWEGPAVFYTWLIIDHTGIENFPEWLPINRLPVQEVNL